MYLFALLIVGPLFVLCVLVCLNFYRRMWRRRTGTTEMRRNEHAVHTSFLTTLKITSGLLSNKKGQRKSRNRMVHGELKTVGGGEWGVNFFLYLVLFFVYPFFDCVHKWDR
jgi:hypothetical protein